MLLLLMSWALCMHDQTTQPHVLILILLSLFRHLHTILFLNIPISMCFVVSFPFLSCRRGHQTAQQECSICFQKCFLLFLYLNYRLGGCEALCMRMNDLLDGHLLLGIPWLLHC